FLFYRSGLSSYLHSFPTRRSSDLVAAEPRQILDPEREVELVLDLEALLLVLGEHRIGDRQRVLGREHRLRRGVHDVPVHAQLGTDRKSTRLNSSHLGISYAVFCLK